MPVKMEFNGRKGGGKVRIALMELMQHAVKVFGQQVSGDSLTGLPHHHQPPPSQFKFPVIDRNPQKFTPSIYSAAASDYVSAVERVYCAHDCGQNNGIRILNSDRASR